MLTLNPPRCIFSPNIAVHFEDTIQSHKEAKIKIHVLLFIKAGNDFLSCPHDTNYFFLFWRGKGDNSCNFDSHSFKLYLITFACKLAHILFLTSFYWLNLERSLRTSSCLLRGAVTEMCLARWRASGSMSTSPVSQALASKP